MIRRAMERPHEPLHNALATLQTRWGSVVVRLGNGGPVGATHGALALAPLPDPAPGEDHPGRFPEGVVSTGFPGLDAILGTPGLPREASAAFRGGPSSGKTTLALRCVAEAQACGAIAAYLDLARTFDPLEAAGRGVDLRWLLVVRPADAAEGFALAGALLSGRSVDLLVVDLPARLPGRIEDQLRRLVAHARRVGARLIVLEPVAIAPALHTALTGTTGLRLELERRAWLCLGRDVVGQRTEVVVAKNRHGPPGRSTTLDIHYLTDGERSIAAHQLAWPDPRLASPSGVFPVERQSPSPAREDLHPAREVPGPAREDLHPAREVSRPAREGPRLVVV